MIELVVAVCMIEQPSRCKDVRLTFQAEAVTVQHCMSYGQLELAKWAGDHPTWKIQRWACQPVGLQAKA